MQYLVDQPLISRLSKNINNRKINIRTRLGYTELATLAAMLYHKDLFSFSDISNYDKWTLEVLKLRVQLESQEN